MKRRIVSIFALIPLLAGCSVGVSPAPAQSPAPVGANPAPAEAPSTAQTPTMEGVPGYPIDQFPPVPLFVMPDLSMLDSSMAGFTIAIRDKFPAVPGVTIRPARCNKGGTVETDTGSLLFYGDGSGTYTSGNGEVVNYGNGAGNYRINGVEVVVYGNGSGTYTKGPVQVISYGDGSGTYTDGTTEVVVYQSGAATYTDDTSEIVNYGNGAGNFTQGSVRIVNYGNGAGTYTDDTIEIINYGNHTGIYTNHSTGEEIIITPDPIAPIAKLGSFPKMGTLKPIKSCGTRITIDDSVLFDFNKDTLRPSAQDTMNKLATLFTTLKIKSAVISGHTDSIGTDEYNQGLSERRADSVRRALIGRNVTTSLEAKGYGETRPVAPNQLNGKDNPAGRQANRRVEIFIPNG